MDEREAATEIRDIGWLCCGMPKKSAAASPATCRYYGISRPTFYKWRNRLEEFGEGRAFGTGPQRR